MDTDSTRSEISGISASPTIQTIATILSTMTQAEEGMKNNLKATKENGAKREVKATKSQIQRGKVEKKTEQKKE